MSIAEKITTIANNVPLVFEAGKQAEYDSFWNGFLQNGKRTNYQYAFAFWNDQIYKPKYVPSPVNANYMFNQSTITNTKINVDFSKCTNITYAFIGCYYLKNIGIVDASLTNGLTYTFSYCRALITIDKLILKDDGTQSFSNAFLECNKLENIIVEGVIGNNISFANSPLNYESLMSIKAALAQVTTPKTLTLKASSFELLTQTDKDQIEAKGWTIVS